ncbi:hypothetical protein YC2023_095169 [Brassica napus]
MAGNGRAGEERAFRLFLTTTEWTLTCRSHLGREHWGPTFRDYRCKVGVDFHVIKNDEEN